MSVGKREERLRKELGTFLHEYGRRNGPGARDRAYDRSVEERLKRMSPEDFDRLVRGDEDDEQGSANAE